MHTKLTIPERLKDLRVSEKRMSLQELSYATGIPSSTLGNYEKDENIDMSLSNLITLANFYNVSTDYLLCRTELRKHKNQSISDLHLNDDAVQILTDEKYNPRLLSELPTHENFKKFMTDLEIYVDGFNDKGIQIANAFLDVMRCKLTELGADSTDAFATVFDNSHIEAEQYYMNILSADLKPIVSDLRNAHIKDSNTASDIDYQSMVKNIIDDFTSQIPTTANDHTESSNDAYINVLLLLFCKNPEMKVTQLSVEEKETLKEIFSRSKPAKEHRKLRRRNPKL
jgi:transcriptional regulator with XRE-family HTH domain